MPCTWLQKVGDWMSSSTCCQCLEHGSMREIRSPIPCCTGQPSVVIVRWHVTSLQKSSWTHWTGTRCVWCQGTVLVSKCKCLQSPICVHGLVCAVKHVVTNRCHVDKFMYSPVFCLQSPIPLFAYWFLFGNGSPMYSVHKLQPASNSRML